MYVMSFLPRNPAAGRMRCVIPLRSRMAWGKVAGITKKSTCRGIALTTLRWIARTLLEPVGQCPTQLPNSAA
jgi:hypothetical protein